MAKGRGLSTLMQAHVYPHTLEEVDALAEKLGFSRSALVREALNRFLERHRKLMLHKERAKYD